MLILLSFCLRTTAQELSKEAGELESPAEGLMGEEAQSLSLDDEGLDKQIDTRM